MSYSYAKSPGRKVKHPTRVGQQPAIRRMTIASFCYRISQARPQGSIDLPMTDGDATIRPQPDPRPSGAQMIFRTVFRLLWAATAFCIAAGIALLVLFVLGALWVGDE